MYFTGLRQYWALSTPVTIEILDTIAQVFLAQGRYVEAKELCQQALAWRETYFGLKHIKTMESRTLMDKLDNVMGTSFYEE
jgi:hypothetical protein